MWAKLFQRRRWRGCNSVHQSAFWPKGYTFQCQLGWRHKGKHARLAGNTTVEWDGSFRVN